MKIFKIIFANGFVILLALVLTLACSTEGVIQQVLGFSTQPPVFIDCRPVSPTELVFRFSHPVTVSSLNFDLGYEAVVVEEGTEVRVAFSRVPEEGRRITADIIVEDSGRNTLNVIVPFRARNERMPKIVFNELRLDYSNPRIEFIEFYVLEGGNLGAMRLFIAHQSMEIPFYEFPPAEVKTGDYIVLHLRTRDDSAVDETGDNLALSGGDGARNDARDLWIPGNRKLLHTPNGIWLMDQDDNILDALLLSQTPASDVSNRTFMAAAEFLGKRNAWLPVSGEAEAGWVPTPSDAILSAGTTATRTLNRDESLPHAPRGSNWYVTVTSGQTPGTANNTRRYGQ